MLRKLNSFALSLGLLSLSLTLLTGCEKQQEARPFSAGDNVDPHDHDHGGLGPHLGHIIELGEEEYHAEVTLDITTRELAVWVLGPDSKTLAPLTNATVALQLTVDGKEQELTLTAAPQEGESEGAASKYEWKGEPLADSIKDAEMLVGSISVAFAEKSYTGKITHDHGHGHDDHGHAH
ncbi:MAG: hypothetical protein R3C01_08245 [Planctomycetaceae bacterium]